MNCNHCGKPVPDRYFPSVDRFCSRVCSGKSKAVVTVEQVQPFVQTGESQKAIARKLGCGPRAVKHALERHGLYMDWYRNRYGYAS
jgi:hypothetical protein